MYCYGNKFGRSDTKDWTLENAKYTKSTKINKGVSENKLSRHNVRCNLLSVSPALTSFILRIQFLFSNFTVKELKKVSPVNAIFTCTYFIFQWNIQRSNSLNSLYNKLTMTWREKRAVVWRFYIVWLRKLRVTWKFSIQRNSALGNGKILSLIHYVDSVTSHELEIVYFREQCPPTIASSHTNPTRYFSTAWRS